MTGQRRTNEVHHVETDGTILGTKLWDEDGNLIRNVVEIQRIGNRTYITTRYKNLPIEGVEGDFALVIPRHNVSVG